MKAEDAELRCVWTQAIPEYCRMHVVERSSRHVKPCFHDLQSPYGIYFGCWGFRLFLFLYNNNMGSVVTLNGRCSKTHGWET